MNPVPNDTLEQDLRELTVWSGAAPGLWTSALDAIRTTPGVRKNSKSLLLRRIRIWGWPAIAVSVVVVLGSSLLISSLSAARYRAKSNSGAPGLQALVTGPLSNESQEWFPNGFFDQIVAGSPAASEAGGGRIGLAEQRSRILGHPSQDIPRGSPATATVPTDRYVVHKAQIELAVDDVAAAFLKAAQLPSEAGGEFVQDSTLKGAGRQAEGNLTLRVAADRLHLVLNELRKLGKVNAENVGGEDVTTQMVDLEARLRNDRRVEEELLKLFDQRQNAPLKEILELRDKLSQVRQTIEQLTAQREHLGRLVSLATILVILRPADAPPPTAPTLLDHFSASISAAFHNGLTFLVDSFAGLIAFLIGGLLWWLLAALVAVVIWRAVRKANKSAA